LTLDPTTADDFPSFSSKHKHKTSRSTGQHQLCSPSDVREQASHMTIGAPPHQ